MADGEAAMEQQCDQGAGPGMARSDSNPGSLREGEGAVATTSASSSNSDLPSALLPDGEHPDTGRRQSKPFTGLKLFGRR